MPDHEEETRSQATDTALADAGLARLEALGLGASAALGVKWLEAVARMNSEALSFLATRLKEDMETHQALLCCKTVEDVQQAQLAFWEKAYAQYAVEAGKLFDITMDAMPFPLNQTKNEPV